MISSLKKITNQIGPGFLVAATGIGAGDMVAATVAGAKFGTVILWVVTLGAIFKYVLNEGIARWQLSNGTTIVQGWLSKFHPIVGYYYVTYLFLWTFIVAGALIAACGLVAHTIFPSLSIQTWGIIHSMAGLILVGFGNYGFLENVMKFFISVMFITIIINTFLMDIDWVTILPSFVIPTIPIGSIKLLLGVVGGIGGSLTVLCYSYWLKEKCWTKASDLPKARKDLRFAYILTALFGSAILILSASVDPEVMSGNKIVIGLANKLGETSGIIGRWIFLIGFWGAVFSSLLGVWDGVPYLFHDYIISKRKKNKSILSIDNLTKVNKSKLYILYLVYMSTIPLVLLFLAKPVWIIILYSISGAFFMPFLAIMLLIMNTRIKWVKKNNNSLFTNIVLVLILLLFVYLLFIKIGDYF
ncbi:MAG: Nramp family divalent metal transporter [Lutibacter sp.]|uniref:Nramp family divalent metal transporter n=1 Tax=Lutibacter sp. TaxID=1925666 RepID=UPI0017DF63A1|nr:Nramp family divalent metal transporter [Lutibacter sp.]MBT8317835.1 Nramp family divalent metal transporter [Lutibacter sp.]NNJ58693.1 Nramp family divalent metal transporter [Lutibacter sp.]